MLKKVTVAISTLFILSVLPIVLFAQTLDGSPYTPGKDADIDLYMNTWKNSQPVITHGTLTEQNILIRGDMLNPPDKGAVLKFVKHFF